MKFERERLNLKSWFDKIDRKAEVCMNKVTEYGVQNRIEPSIKTRFKHAGNIAKLLGLVIVGVGHPIYHLEKTKNSYEGPVEILSSLLEKGYSKDEIVNAV